MNGIPPLRIDMHMHVGLLGDRWPQWGKLSDWYRQQLVYKLFLLYARIEEAQVCDRVLRDTAIKTIESSLLDKVVCLALDPVYDSKGQRQEGKSNLWVDNEYIIKELRPALGNRLLLGASVHPYDVNFEARVKRYIDEGAVLLKWLPSAQQIDLSEEKVRKSMLFLAEARSGKKPLPLLLHIGPEYAIPTSDSRTTSYDYLTWSWRDGLWNFFRGSKRWYVPKVRAIRDNIKEALDAGAIIIFAHCGLPYFFSGVLGNLLEHSEFEEVKRYLQKNSQQVASGKGRCYADVSAFCTPFRKNYFKDVRNLTSQYLLFGSDYPTPAFELSADLGEMIDDLKAVLGGQLYRVVIPQDNLLDVNYRELRKLFPGHKLFENFSAMLTELQGV